MRERGGNSFTVEVNDITFPQELAGSPRLSLHLHHLSESVPTTLPLYHSRLHRTSALCSGGEFYSVAPCTLPPTSFHIFSLLHSWCAPLHLRSTLIVYITSTAIDPACQLDRKINHSYILSATLVYQPRTATSLCPTLARTRSTRARALCSRGICFDFYIAVIGIAPGDPSRPVIDITTVHSNNSYCVSAALPQPIMHISLSVVSEGSSFNSRYGKFVYDIACIFLCWFSDPWISTNDHHPQERPA